MFSKKEYAIVLLTSADAHNDDNRKEGEETQEVLRMFGFTYFAPTKVVFGKDTENWGIITIFWPKIRFFVGIYNKKVYLCRLNRQILS